MNAAEKKVLHIAFILFAIGLLVRILPWSVPSIESFDVGEMESSSLEIRGPEQSLQGDFKGRSKQFVNKLNNEKTSKKGRKSKKSTPKVTLPIHINSASVDELCALKGVGPKLAEKILAHREAFGPFKTPSDVKKVPGIGNKKAEGILQGIIFD